MPPSRPRLTHALMLVLGLAMGLTLAAQRSPRLQAGGSDRSGESALVAGAVSIGYDEGTKTQVPQEALYYLDYKAGKLTATIPMYRQSSQRTTYLEPFAERDLVADFKIDLDNGPRPHFLMTTGHLGTFGQGWAPLFVFETNSGRVAVYRIQKQTVGLKYQLQFELLELGTSRPPVPDATTARPTR